MNASVEPIRHAARQLVRELHLLDGRVECCGIPLSECHLITELNSMGEATASDLCERLVLEKSTMSRLVNKLVDKGLICASCCQDDRRARLLCLTKEGKAQAEKVDQHAQSQVASALEFVSPDQEKAVIEGLTLYASSLRRARLAGPYQIRQIQLQDCQGAAAVIQAVMQEFGLGSDVTLEAEAKALQEHAFDTGSAFFVVAKGAEILGCGGIRPRSGTDAATCELHSMYFMKELRGRGLGSQLVHRILAAAREAGYRHCYLETSSRMDSARALYRKHGWKEVENRIGEGGRCGCNRFMLLDLT